MFVNLTPALHDTVKIDQRDVSLINNVTNQKPAKCWVAENSEIWIKV